MSLGEKLLNLTVEYQQSVANREDGWPLGTPVGREPSEIAADYEIVLKELLS